MASTLAPIVPKISRLESVIKVLLAWLYLITVMESFTRLLIHLVNSIFVALLPCMFLTVFLSKVLLFRYTYYIGN